MGFHKVAAQAAELVVGGDQCSSEYEVACFALLYALTPAQREMLNQLVFEGPVEDGDALSKSSRDDLLALGLAHRVCVKGEQGFTAGNYYAANVLAASI